ncbi:F0F1 ATP synthase subunit B [Candidatus Enterovibrio escicola]|uniref:ATP synthase subunit b n=1 Tax=Candidatus Enterovibrio escicola TaxID=1927127 RepID=A0A2A5T562_9GAMM|nr:F0F1 ATP synthase subunit B [Candidatus Enterovibrio escacola]PCS23293.1 ATP synthase F0 sector subunit b [Candidatus Enterovibrio escacola]
MNINATLFGQAIAFFIFVRFCMKYVWPPIMQAIEARQNKIADGLSAADRAVKDLNFAQVKVSDKLKEAKRTATKIIDQAYKRKAQIMDQARNEANAERDSILNLGQAELEAENRRARDELRKQVAALAVIGAEKIIKRSIDKNTHKDILDKIASEL